MLRKAEAEWKGSLKNGKGIMTLGSGAYSGMYSFSSRFEQGKGTNPEELIAAAHAGCFSMALSGRLTEKGHPPVAVHTTATVALEKSPDGFEISRIDLDTEADVPGIDEQDFMVLAEEAKKNCPVSKALAGPKITLKARLTQMASAH